MTTAGSASAWPRSGSSASVNDEVGEIIVADVNAHAIQALVAPDAAELERLIAGS